MASQRFVSKRFILILFAFLGLAGNGSALAGSLSLSPQSQTDLHIPGATFTYTVQLCVNGDAAAPGSIVLDLVRSGSASFQAFFGVDANSDEFLDASEMIATGSSLAVPLAADTCVPLLVRVKVLNGASIGDVATHTLTATHATLAPGGVNAQIATSAGDALPAVTVTIQPGAGASTVTSSPPGIQCPGTCTYNFREITSVYLTAAPAVDRTFTGWTGCTDITNGVCRLYMDTAKNVTATFAEVPHVQGDFNADGRSDLLLYNNSTSTVYEIQMNGLSGGGAAGAIESRPNSNWKVAAVADLNGSGTADIVWHNSVSGDVSVVLMQGLTRVSSADVYREPNPSWKIVGAGDFDGDNRADLLWRNDDTGDVFLLLMNGTSVVGGDVIYSEPNKNWRVEKVADFDGDRRMDILWRNTVTGDVFVLLVNGTSISGGGVIYSEPNTSWQIQAAADFNGDGRADILWRNNVSGELFMMLMNGTTITSGSLFYTEPNASWKIEGTGDYDGDGNADIAWRHQTSSQVFVMLMNGPSIVQAGALFQVGGYRIVGP